jgi:prepilin-type N-terminal cleavage/methylation domain-containing protein
MEARRGFTLIELIVVIAVLSILAGVGIPAFLILTERAKVAADEATLKILNDSTLVYAAIENIRTSDIFAGINEDDARIEELVDAGILDKPAVPQKKDAEFNWHVEYQRWLYSIYEVSGSLQFSYIFKEMFKDDFTYNLWGGGGTASWDITEDGLYSNGANGNGLIFIGNASSEYVLTSNFELGSTPNQIGGVGIFFETTIDPDNSYRDNGYLLQFDRGFSEIVIRKRVNGTESSSDIIARIGNRSTSTVKNTSIPYRSNDDWWQSKKEISISVTESDNEGYKKVSVTLDGEVILSDLEIESNIEPANNFTGYRAWNGSSATVYDLTIE